MPCNGVAVATGRLEMNVTELIFTIPPDTLRDTLAAALVQHDPALEGAKPKKPYKYDRGVTDFGFRLGRYLIGIQKSGRVNVSLNKGQTASDRQTVQAIYGMIKDLMAGLAGLALQQQLARQIIAAGYQVDQIRQAPNGALVLEVEL